jgi:acyl-ACP thioesterase
MQEASIRHTEELGMGREMTLDRGLLWMVTLQRAEIARMPEYDELITLESWPGDTMHLLFPRYYRVLDEKGETLVAASALWALVDQNTRRMVFPDRYGVVIEGEKTGNEIALPSPPLRAKEGAVSAFTVPYSYVDLNGHMNNTRYFDLTEDLLGAAAAGRELRRIRAEYLQEVRLGDTLTVSWDSRDDNSFRIEGRTQKPCYRMELKYR